MKAFILVWAIIMAILMLIGWIWYYIDSKNVKRKKGPLILIVVGSFLMAIYFLVLLPLMKR